MRFPGPTHLLVLTKHWDERLESWIERFLEGKLKLTINREKTKVVDMREEQAAVNFLGYSFQMTPDLFGRKKQFLNISEYGTVGQSDEEGTGEPA